MGLSIDFRHAGEVAGKAAIVGSKVVGYTLATALAVTVALKGADLFADGVMTVCEQVDQQLDRAIGPNPRY